ncbi:hypothetical protein RFI_39422, partial [Reticulomyxa filosa]
NSRCPSPCSVEANQSRHYTTASDERKRAKRIVERLQEKTIEDSDSEQSELKVPYSTIKVLAAVYLFVVQCDVTLDQRAQSIHQTRQYCGNQDCEYCQKIFVKYSCKVIQFKIKDITCYFALHKNNNTVE